MKRILYMAMFLFSLNSVAQVGLGMGRFGFLAPADTVMGGTSGTYDVWVKNYGPGTFNDILVLNTAVQDTTPAGLDSVGYYETPSNVVINAGDSLLVTLTADYTVSANGYRYGIDVIVIWPVAASAITLDSLVFSVFIADETGLSEKPGKEQITVYPNPSSGTISIENTGGRTVESVILYDMNGRVVLSEKGHQLVNIEDLAPGTYQAEVILSDKKRYSARIVKGKKNAE